MAISVNGPGTPGPRGPEGPTGPAGTLTANTGISIGGTLETSHVVPLSVDTYDLGNTANYFRNLYIGTGSIYMMSADGKEAKLSMDNDGELSFKRQTRLSLSSQSGKTTKVSTDASTGGTGGTGATGCGSAINFKYGGGTEDSQGFYTKGKFWSIDDANDSGCTFMNLDKLVINGWEDTPCNRNWSTYMSNLPYCGRIDIFPQGWSGSNQAWARFYYSEHYNIGGFTQSGGISAGYETFVIDQNEALHSYDGPSGGSAAFITGNEYEVRFYPFCAEGGDGVSGGSGGNSGDDGTTQDPPSPTYPHIRRYGVPRWLGFTLEGTVAGGFGISRFALGGSGASGGVVNPAIGADYAVVNVDTISELYVNNMAPSNEGFINDNPFLSSLNTIGQITLRGLYGNTATNTWVRYNYSAFSVSGGTGEDGYVRFTGMTLDAFGPNGATATTVYEIQKSILTFNSIEATCGSDYTFTFRGLTTNTYSQMHAGGSLPATGDMWFRYLSTVGDTGGATFADVNQVLLDQHEASPCSRDLATMYQGLPNCGRIDILPEDYVNGYDGAYVGLWYNTPHGNWHTASGGGLHHFSMDDWYLQNGNQVAYYNSASGSTAMLEIGKRYNVRFTTWLCNPYEGGGESGDGATAHPDAPAYPCTYRYGATQGATAMRDPGEGFFGVSGASVGYTTLGGGATVADIRYINGLYIDNYSPNGSGLRYDGDFLDSLSQTGQVTLTRLAGATSELWAKYNYTYHAGTGGSGGYRILSGMTLAAWGPSGGYTSGSYGDFHIPLERSGAGVVPWKMCFENVAGYTCEPYHFTFEFRGVTGASTCSGYGGCNSGPGQGYCLGTGGFWLTQNTVDAGGTFGQIEQIITSEWEAGPCNRNLWYEMQALPSRGNVMIRPEDFSGITSDVWVNYWYSGRWENQGPIGAFAWMHFDDYTIGNHVRAYNGASGATAMLEEGKRYVLSYWPEWNEGQDGGGSGGSTAHPDAPAYPCTYRYGATQGATAMRDPGSGFFGVSGGSAAYTTLGGGATVVDIRSINEMYIDTYSPNGSGLRYDGDFLSGLDQTGKITLTRLNGGTAELWARFTYDVHGNTLGTGGYHRFQGVTLDTWGPSGGYTSGSYGDYHIPMDRTSTGVVPWKMCFEDTAVTGPTASLGTNQFSFHYKSGTADSDPTYGFFKLGGTGAGDSLMEATELYIDNFEENGEYGTGRYIGDFLDNLDNTGTVTITPFGMTGNSQWVQYYYTTEVQGITASGGTGGYHKIVGLSGGPGQYLGNSFGTVSGTSGPYMIEFNDTVGVLEFINGYIHCPDDFDNTGLAYPLYVRPYTTTIERIGIETGTGGGCTGTVYIGGMQSNPVSGCSGMAVSRSYTNFHAATCGNTYCTGNTAGANQQVFLNLQGFTLAGSTGCPNYVHSCVWVRRTDGF